MATHSSDQSSSARRPSSPASVNPGPSLETDDQKTLRSLLKAERQVADGHYDPAIHTLNGLPQLADVRNLKGICLMRKGQGEQAVQHYRSYVLHSGTGRCRSDLHETHVLNFATALLISGRPAGCLDVLADLRGTSHPYAARLRNAIRNWARGLGWWSRLNWWVGKLEPDPCVVTLDFLPGEFQSSVPVSVTGPAAGAAGRTSTHSAV